MIHISRITLKNFKSFRRCSIPIFEGFTAIVGPNGSGKSNIVDAICFVLGRSSAKSLRAERFSDLIFNGGKKEKPAKEAEVTLYLDNSGRELPLEEKEVKISRSIDITGNSVYRLNGKRSNRNEILDVLAHAKILPDGHNIVLQGDITSIIEMNPVERRGLIDKIAGIAEYDERKRKALRELEKVSENISKVEAVLGEVNENLQKLEKERSDALRHEFLKGEIKRSKGIVLHSRNIQTQEGIKKLGRTITEGEKNIERINKYLNVLTLRSEVRKKELENLNASIILKEETEQFANFREIEKLKNELAYCEEKITTVKNELELLEKKCTESKAHIVDTFDEIKKCRSQNEVLDKELAEIESKIAGIKSRIEAAYGKISKDDKTASDLKQKLIVVKTELENAQNALFEVEKENALFGEKKAEKERISADLIKDLEEKKSKLTELNALLKTNASKKKEIESKLENAVFRKQELVQQSIELRKKIEKINAVLPIHLQEHAKLLGSCRAMEESKKTFSGAISEILKLKDGGVKGIYGTVAELGKVNPKFSKALEAAAGRGLEFVVVSDEDVAEKCINHLKEKKIGRATFLPLSKLKVTEPSTKETEIARHSYDFALNLVEFDEKFRPAFAYVFRNTVVVENIAFAKHNIGGARMVTLDGDLVETSGAMSGGFYKTSGAGFEEIDATKKKLEKLEAEIKKLEKERSALIKKDAELKKELENLVSSEAEAAREVEILSGRLNTTKSSVDELIKHIAEKEALAKVFSAEQIELSKKIENNEKEIKRLYKRISELGEDKNALEKEFESSSENILKDIKTLESQILELEKERESKKAQIVLSNSKIKEMLKPKIAEAKKSLLAAFSSKKNMCIGLKTFEDKKRALEDALSKLKNKEGSITEEIKKLKERREFFIGSVRKIEAKKEALKEKLLEITKKIEHAKIENARLEAKLEEINEALKHFTDMEIQLLEPVDTVELEREIAKMEAELTSLEPINMRAVEDYVTVKEKFEVLNTRTEKLLAEKQAILTLMDEIEHRKKSIFMEVFENIAMNFRRIFMQLSNGGEANLLLAEENPLEGGLQIQAKPPGKNPQYIELMSGGEKTLTALSFIFAIQRYQPAPFYIMDEIDMFLDDKNVKLVSELVKEASKEAQFIVISLREAMMTSADWLLGVANEDGMSKIIGVELEKVGRSTSN